MLNLLSASMNGITQIADDLVILLFLSVLTIITLFGSIWFISLNVNKSENAVIGKMKVSAVVSVVVVAGILIRIAFSLTTNGYLGLDPSARTANAGGMTEIYETISAVIKNGLSSKDVGIYPVPFYLFTIFGGFIDIFGGLNSANITLSMRIALRLPLIICDAVTAVILFKIAKKYLNSYVGLALAVLYMFCPIFFFSSGMWGSTLSIFTLFLILSLYFMTNKNFLGLTIAYSFALLCSKDAMYLAPVFLVFTAYYLIKSIKSNRKNSEKLAFKKWFLDGERGLIFRIPLYLIGSLILMYLINLPLLGDINYSFWGWFNSLFIAPFRNIYYLSYNSLSIYNLFGRNNSAINSAVPTLLFGFLFFVLASALTMVVYVSRKNRAIMVLSSSYVVFTLSAFYMGFSELNLVPMLAVLLLSFVLIKDKRILHIFSVLSLTILLNALAVMMSAGYLSTANYVSYGTGYTGTVALSKTLFGNLMSMFMTGITLLGLVYMTLIILDIALSNKILQFDVRDRGFVTFIKSWFSFREK